MPESPPPPPAARRGPPPLPASITETSIRPSVGAIDELYQLAEDEVARGTDPARGDELRVRLALLSWDARSDGKAAAAWLDKVDHPAAAALRRELALASDDPAPLTELADEALA